MSAYHILHFVYNIMAMISYVTVKYNEKL